MQLHSFKQQSVGWYQQADKQLSEPNFHYQLKNHLLDRNLYFWYIYLIHEDNSYLLILQSTCKLDEVDPY